MTKYNSQLRQLYLRRFTFLSSKKDSNLSNHYNTYTHARTHTYCLTKIYLAAQTNPLPLVNTMLLLYSNPSHSAQYISKCLTCPQERK